ncbi:hypothetical protein N7492_001403 [Penicillium capsulatum]|uniref:Uncharacterized protein n=1 Tax=Penicillium capsulatum TaxID=69766 RepID=A0A9W9M141_9EURO|nr:hypothetical protein N7492_001403 [Penicillium capsulatum]
MTHDERLANDDLGAKNDWMMKKSPSSCQNHQAWPGIGKDESAERPYAARRRIARGEEFRKPALGTNWGLKVARHRAGRRQMITAREECKPHGRWEAAGYTELKSRAVSVTLSGGCQILALVAVAAQLTLTLTPHGVAHSVLVAVTTMGKMQAREECRARGLELVAPAGGGGGLEQSKVYVHKHEAQEEAEGAWSPFR